MYVWQRNVFYTKNKPRGLNQRKLYIDPELYEEYKEARRKLVYEK